MSKLKAHQIERTKAKVLLLGATFKENTADIRNSKAITLAQVLQKEGLELTLYDPYINEKNPLIAALDLASSLPKAAKFDVVILAVGHDQFKTIQPLALLTEKGFAYDIKAYFDAHPRIYRL